VTWIPGSNSETGSVDKSHRISGGSNHKPEGAMLPSPYGPPAYLLLTRPRSQSPQIGNHSISRRKNSALDKVRSFHCFRIENTKSEKKLLVPEIHFTLPIRRRKIRDFNDKTVFQIRPKLAVTSCMGDSRPNERDFVFL